MKKFPSINRFSDIVVQADKVGETKLRYVAKPKLHGTQASIVINSDNTLIAQSKNQQLTGDNKHYGFANFVDGLTVNLEDTISKYVSKDLNIEPPVIYGEWAGPGVQQVDAVCNIPEKTFFVFAVRLESNWILESPSVISMYIKTVFGENNRIKTLPWALINGRYVFEFDLSNMEESQKKFDSLKDYINTHISKVDPYIKEEYGIEGPGEGFVFYPIIYEGDQASHNLGMWKLKTDAHGEFKVKKDRIVPIKPEGIEEFINMFFTEVRFEKMFNEHVKEYHRKNTGLMLKAVMQDVKKESENELELADFEWKDVGKFGTPVIKRWFFNECDRVG